jgi:PHD/YefM family antitoxin component YafN of YafNO toxin-antitoxin module
MVVTRDGHPGALLVLAREYRRLSAEPPSEG